MVISTTKRKPVTEHRVSSGLVELFYTKRPNTGFFLKIAHTCIHTHRIEAMIIDVPLVPSRKRNYDPVPEVTIHVTHRIWRNPSRSDLEVSSLMTRRSHTSLQEEMHLYPIQL